MITMIRITISFLSICGIMGMNSDIKSGEIETRNNELTENGYIPTSIPTNITRVVVIELDAKDSVDDNVTYINSSMFANTTWIGVKYLEFKTTTNASQKMVIFTHNCFIHLTNLEELHIHFVAISLKGEPFYGLSKLSMLDLAGARRMTQSELETSLAGTKSAPNLKYLDISNIWNKGMDRYLSIDRKLVSIIFSKPLKGLNLSNNKIQTVDGQAMSEFCGEMEYVNISGCSFISYTDSKAPLCISIGVADASYVDIYILLKKEVRFRVSRNEIINDTTMSGIQFSTVKDVILDGILNGAYITGGAMLTYHHSYRSQFVSFRARHNKLKRLDVKFNFPEVKYIKHLDLAMNELEFINPMFLNSSWNILDYLDLSDNRLYQMVIEDELSFSRIARSYPNLRHIGLAANNLTDIPKSTFEYNQLLEEVDLSRNQLTKFRLIFNKNGRLQKLYLHNNKIATLDAYGRQCLNLLHRNVSVTLSSNPISCSSCDDYEFIDWILRSPVIVKKGRYAVTCINPDGDRELINQDTADRLQKVCKENTDQRNRVIFSTTFVSAFLMVTIFIVCYLRNYFKAKKTKKDIEDTIALIQNDATQYAVFLSFCSEDEDFVNDHVFEQLENTLREVFRVDRVLVSTGDRNFRLGRWIPEETVEALKHSYVVIIVVSDAYCQRHHCRMEFEQAYDLRKPIILMYKGHVQEDLMFPVMREHYNRYTRILWEYNNIDSEYKLKTTWLNIGTSILEMLKDS